MASKQTPQDAQFLLDRVDPHILQLRENLVKALECGNLDRDQEHELVMQLQQVAWLRSSIEKPIRDAKVAQINKRKTA